MYHQNEKQIARAIAGAHDDIILSHRPVNESQNNPSCTDNTASEIDMSKDISGNAGNKKKQRKRKQRQVKKYIKQGKLPSNYTQLPREEKDRLFLAVRRQITEDQSETDHSILEQHDNKEDTHVNEDDKEDENFDIKIDTKEIDI